MPANWHSELSKTQDTSREGEMPVNWHSELSKTQIERPLEETETSQCISRVLARGVLASGNQELRSAI